jgi:hypothetical protein
MQPIRRFACIREHFPNRTETLKPMLTLNTLDTERLLAAEL